MKAASIVLAAVAMITGLLAANYWSKASKPVEIPELYQRTADEAFARMGESASIQQALADSARLNALGARLAAVAAAASGISALLGALG